MSEDLEGRAQIEKARRIEWKKNVEYFKEHKEEIEKKYGRKQFVALNHEKGILGDDKDKFNLITKIQKEYGYIGFLVTSIESSERTVHLRIGRRL
jgi:hypothetical protein